jgi:hypothetical protein
MREGLQNRWLFKIHEARFEVLVMIKFQVTVFCVMTPCSDMVKYQHFVGPCCLQLHGEGPPKHWYPTSSLHTVTTQKAVT